MNCFALDHQDLAAPHGHLHTQVYVRIVKDVPNPPAFLALRLCASASGTRLDEVFTYPRPSYPHQIRHLDVYGDDSTHPLSSLH